VLLEGVRSLKRGECTAVRLRELQQLGRTMQDASKCGLGQTSPNFFLSLVDQFGPEILDRVPV
jgi:[NiFe] hydrogenase diaphorase moiety large subunit